MVTAVFSYFQLNNPLSHITTLNSSDNVYIRLIVKVNKWNTDSRFELAAVIDIVLVL